MSEINITYETLFELSRRERNRDEIQELTSSFQADVAQYLDAKEKLISESTDSQKSQKQLDNARKILKELYEKREKKILLMALYRSRTGSDIMKTDNLLDGEKCLYNEIKNVCDRYRIQMNQAEVKCGPESTEAQPSAAKPISANSTVRFTAPVPRFVGRELETYGPYDAEDVVSIPSDIAEVLIKKGRAEAIED